jgi:AmmeMemoRadiSam system protein B/AmmeMemoRadiSam system protein A
MCSMSQTGNQQTNADRPKLTDEQRCQVHRAACRLVAGAVYGRDLLLDDPSLAGAADISVMGAFVTLKRRGRLRGCCGILGQPMALLGALRQSARRTACEDIRMPAVSGGELPYSDLDVSLLHDFRPIKAHGTDRIRCVEVGRHGLQIRRGQASGLLLPNVATEYNLDAEQFLRQVCHKAGLATTAWSEPDTRLMTFESCFIEGKFDTSVLQDVDQVFKPLLTDDQLVRLAGHCRANVMAHLRGATPNYYLGDCPDGMVHGAAITVRSGTSDPPIHVSQLSLRPAIPLQATLSNLTAAAANAVRSQVLSVGDQMHVGVTVLEDPAMHGTLADPDLRGLDTAHRALLLQEGGHLTWKIDPTTDADGLLRETIKTVSVASPDITALYSMAFKTSESEITVSDVPRAETGNGVRLPAVAGTFYPGDKDQLQHTVDGLLDDTAPPPQRWRAALVPHAGLRYSGRIAAAVLQRIDIPPTAIVICPKHTRFGVPWAVAPHQAWSIPGATLAGDVGLARTLADTVPAWQLDTAAHRAEHAIEVELPLLARLAPRTQVVGVAIAPASLERCREFSRGLAEVLKPLDPQPLLLISSDLNHYASDEENRRLDGLAIEAMKRLDAEDLHATVTDHHISMCGMLPAVIVLETLRVLGQLSTCQQVAYGTSGDVTGDSSRVVGYAGMLFR